MQNDPLGFDDLNLTFGQLLEAMPENNPSKEFSPVALLGAIPGESLIISAPSSGEFPVMEEGEKVIFRLNLSDGIAMFSSHVLFISDMPLFMVYVDYPQDLRFKKIRQASRVQVSLPVLLSNSAINGKSGIAGKITDISTMGAGLEAYESLGDAGDAIVVKGKFTIGKVQRVLSIRATIRTQSKSIAGHYIYGVEFIDGDEDDFLVLSGFIFNAMAFGKLQKVR